MAMASRRLNERLAKYNYLYDDEDDGAMKTPASDIKMDSNGSATTTGMTDKLSNGITSINNNSMDSTSPTTEPPRVNTRKLAHSVSNDSTAHTQSAEFNADNTVSTAKHATVTKSLSSGAPRGPLLSSVTASSPRSNLTNNTSSNPPNNAPPPRESIAARNVSSVLL